MKYPLLFVLSILCLLSAANAQISNESEKDSLLYIFQNNEDLLPLDKLNRTVFRTTHGMNPSGFGNMLNKFTCVPLISRDSSSFFKSCMPNDVHIVSFMAPENDSIASLALDNFFKSLQKLPNEKVIAIIFGVKNNYNTDHIIGLPF